MKGLLKGMFGVTIGSSLLPTVMTSIGNIGSGMSSGMKNATQSLVGVGFVGHTASMFKKVFK